MPPVYEYLNPATGETREAFREVRERDVSPAPGFFRVQVPARVSVVNGGAPAPGDALPSMEAAWKHAENSGDLAKARAKGIVTVSTKQARDHMKMLREHTAAAQAATPYLQRSSASTTPGLGGLTLNHRTSVHKRRPRQTA